MPLLAELAMDDGFTKVLFWSNSNDDNFNFILQAIKTRRNIKILKQDGYSERAVLYDRKSDPEAKPQNWSQNGQNWSWLENTELIKAGR